MDERRRARVGTVSGLALLTGGTAVAAVTGGRHSTLATIALGLLAGALGHALMDEARRQASRRVDWAWQDTVNSLLLGAWAVTAALGAAIPHLPSRERAVSTILAAVPFVGPSDQRADKLVRCLPPPERLCPSA